MSRIVSGPGWDNNPASAGHYFFSPYDWGRGGQCPQEVQDAEGYVVVGWEGCSVRGVVLGGGGMLVVTVYLGVVNEYAHMHIHIS